MHGAWSVILTRDVRSMFEPKLSPIKCSLVGPKHNFNGLDWIFTQKNGLDWTYGNYSKHIYNNVNNINSIFTNIS